MATPYRPLSHGSKTGSIHVQLTQRVVAKNAVVAFHKDIYYVDQYALCESCMEFLGKAVRSILPARIYDGTLYTWCGANRQTCRRAGGEGGDQRRDILALSAEDLVMAVHKASTKKIEILSRTSGDVDQVCPSLADALHKVHECVRERN